MPLVRAVDPTLGSTTRMASGESGNRCVSATTPSFIWSRTVMASAQRLGWLTERSYWRSRLYVAEGDAKLAYRDGHFRTQRREEFRGA